MNKTLVVMGNGPSLKNVDFNQLNSVDSFGLNASYRAYERMGWYPTYHGSFDYVVTASHKVAYINLVKTSPIKRFFYLEKLCASEKLQKINLIPFGTDKWNCDEKDFSSFGDGGNSGVNACQVGVCLGYKKIILLGVDCKYVEIVNGASRTPDGRLAITEEISENPNYWFDDYQQKGDRYNLPQTEKFHLPAWARFARNAHKNGIEVINCSTTTELNCFRRSTLEEEV